MTARIGSTTPRIPPRYLAQEQAGKKRRWMDVWMDFPLILHLLPQYQYLPGNIGCAQLHLWTLTFPLLNFSSSLTDEDSLLHVVKCQWHSVVRPSVTLYKGIYYDQTSTSAKADSLTSLWILILKWGHRTKCNWIKQILSILASAGWAMPLFLTMWTWVCQGEK